MHFFCRFLANYLFNFYLVFCEIIWIAIVLQVSCQLLQSFNADSSFFGLTEHSWTFFTSLGWNWSWPWCWWWWAKKNIIIQKIQHLRKNNYCIKSQTRRFTTFTLKSPSIQRQTCFLTFGENPHCNHRNHLRWDPSHHN